MPLGHVVSLPTILEAMHRAHSAEKRKKKKTSSRCPEGQINRKMNLPQKSVNWSWISRTQAEEDGEN